MDKINALSIQRQLQEREYISIPWIQQTFRLTYLEAKEFHRRLESRGWVSDRVDGIQYAVRRENLKLRELTRPEAEQLYQVYTNECNIIMSALVPYKRTGTTMEVITKRVRSLKDAAEAIKVLLEYNLIYHHGDLFFPCVSSKTIEMLSDMMDLKRRQSRLLDLTEEETADGLPPNIAELFYEFFSGKYEG